MYRKLAILAVVVGIFFGAAMPASVANAQEGARIAGDAGLYTAFGEKAGLVGIMDDFMANLLKDPRTRPFFENADQTRVKEQLVDQFCFILNGPCEYKGAKMKPMHAGLGITRENFNALVEQLQIAMDKHAVPFRAQNRLLAVLAPMHRDIVTK